MQSLKRTASTKVANVTFPQVQALRAAIADANTNALERTGAIEGAVEACASPVRLCPDVYFYVHARERLV